MAKLSDEVLDIIFGLQRQLIEGIDEAAAVEAVLFERYGEIELTIAVLEQLDNIQERLLSPYSRLGTLLPRIAEYQPIAPMDVLNLLYETIAQAQSARDAAAASIQEVKLDFDLL